MATKQKKNGFNVDSYKRILDEHMLLEDLFSSLTNKFTFPIDSVLEIGTGIGTLLTRYLIENERAKNIDKFYAMEPVDEFFEESKRHVVRLSRTDATSQEYFGGNPFDVITFSMVMNHIKPEEKDTFIENLGNNFKDGGKLVMFDVFIPGHEDITERTEKVKEHLQEQRMFFKGKNEFMMNYFTNVMNDIHEDYWIGNYRMSIDEFISKLEEEDFINIKAELYRGETDIDWEKMGYYIITADREE